MSKNLSRAYEIQEINLILEPLGKKMCLRCERIQFLQDFHASSLYGNRRYPYCKTCRSKQRKQHYRDNQERIKQQNNTWKDNNRAFHNAYCREYNVTHFEERKSYQQSYNQRNPEKNRQHAASHYALKKGTSIGKVSYKQILERDGYTCHICKQAIAPEDLQFDHVIPLARGGSHTEENIKPSHANCNKRKWAHILENTG